MGSVANVVAKWGLAGTGDPTAKDTSANPRIGRESGSVNLSSANQTWTFWVTSTGAGDVVTIALATGDATKTTGTPDVTRFGSGTSDLTGLDFEGVDLGTIASYYSVLIERTTAAAGTFTAELKDGVTVMQKFTATAANGVSTAQWTLNSGEDIVSETLVLTSAAAGDVIKVTIASST